MDDTPTSQKSLLLYIYFFFMIIIYKDIYNLLTKPIGKFGTW